MYFADLTPCSYSGVREQDGLSVGWLDKLHEFPRGPVPAGFVQRLAEICKSPFVKHLGFHVCEFCDLGPDETYTEAAARSSAVIRVVGRNGTVYFSPFMICHYITRHDYQPPEDFIIAVMDTD